MGIDQFLENLFFILLRIKLMLKIYYHHVPLKAFKYGGTEIFIDDLCALNVEGEFAKCHKEMHAPELELKIEQQGHNASFFLGPHCFFHRHNAPHA